MIMTIMTIRLIQMKNNLHGLGDVFHDQDDQDDDDDYEYHDEYEYYDDYDDEPPALSRRCLPSTELSRSGLLPQPEIVIIIIMKKMIYSNLKIHDEIHDDYDDGIHDSQ